MANLDNFQIPSEFDKPDWPPAAYEQILVEMGRLIFNWNSIENSTRNLLTFLAGNTQAVEILTLQLGTQSQIDSLKSYANLQLSGDQKDHVLHIHTLYSRLREYRNFFVHSFSTIMGPVPTAKMTSVRARGNYFVDEARFNNAEFKNVSRIIRCAVHYFNLVYCHFRYENDTRPDYDAYRALPEMFPIPDQIEKERRVVAAR